MVAKESVKKERRGASAPAELKKGMIMKKLIAGLFAVVAMIAIGVYAGTYNAPEKIGSFAQVTAGEDIDAGVMVCVWTNALVYEADDTASYVMIGRAESSVESGDSLIVKGGVFRYVNKGSFTDKDLGTVAYVWTNDTHYSVGTAAAASNDIEAGTIVDVDSDGVWIDTRIQ